MNGKERILMALERKEPDAVPTFEWDINREVCRALTGSPDQVESVELLDVDGIAVRPDYSKNFITENVYVDEWGGVRQVTGEFIAVVKENPIKDIRDHWSYTFPDPAAPHRFETLRKAVTKFGERRAVVFNVRDVFSDIRDLVGYENALVAMIAEREAYAKLLDRVIEYNYTLAKTAKERFGVNILATTDDYADSRGLIFGPKLFFDFLAPRFKEVIRGFKELGYHCIKHCDGNIMDVLEFFIDCGVDCIDPVDPNGGMEIGDIKKKYGDHVCLKGNIDCERTLVTGSEDEVRGEVRDCIRKAAGGGGFILSSSNTIHSGVKPENYRVMLEALRRFGKYPLDQ
jgi:uroporphyrinogen decarboxylase